MWKKSTETDINSLWWTAIWSWYIKIQYTWPLMFAKNLTCKCQKCPQNAEFVCQLKQGFVTVAVSRDFHLHVQECPLREFPLSSFFPRVFCWCLATSRFVCIKNRSYPFQRISLMEADYKFMKTNFSIFLRLINADMSPKLTPVLWSLEVYCVTDVDSLDYWNVWRKYTC